MRHCATVMRLGTILERERLREHIHLELYFGSVLERERLRFVYQWRYLELSIRMRFRRRHMGQRDKLLQNAGFANGLRLLPVRAVLEWERVREYIHDRLSFGPVLEWLELCYVLEREFVWLGTILERLRLCGVTLSQSIPIPIPLTNSGLFQCTIRMRFRRRLMGQWVKFLPDADLICWFKITRVPLSLGTRLERRFLHSDATIKF